MWRKPPYRWRPASWNVGKKGQSPSMVVVRPSPTPRPVVVTQEKSGGSLFAVILGVAAVAFGVMELTGVTHVFGTTPAPKPAAPAPGTAAAPSGAAAPAPGTAPAAAPSK